MLIGSSAERAAKEKRVRTPGVAAEEKKWRISRAIRIMEGDSIKGRLTSDERIEFARFGPLPVPGAAPRPLPPDLTSLLSSAIHAEILDKSSQGFAGIIGSGERYSVSSVYRHIFNL